MGCALEPLGLASTDLGAAFVALPVLEMRRGVTAALMSPDRLTAFGTGELKVGSSAFSSVSQPQRLFDLDQPAVPDTARHLRHIALPIRSSQVSMAYPAHHVLLAPAHEKSARNVLFSRLFVALSIGDCPLDAPEVPS